ncbi:class I SAM-dependent methyltransferase [Paraconexibacter antarcticus]|uniref:Class I SAM-dependent methyltransferase n=1 Tax=Paraconexibacter antarcticus TaxID=2949664 RepID=A0ABY5DZY2_9ACTN|nr:class I SAM-dependent methyltransferase [Paraconexibacter antarcticus]UTI66397.1 class I SAM-dependent methyltransferase [Paraconexibacter antarcticus]
MRLSVRPDTIPEAVGLAAGLAPEPIFDSYVALMQARTLMVAARVGIFAALAEAPADAPALAARLGLTEAGLDVVLPALRALGYLDADAAGRVHRLSAKGRRTMTPGGRTSVTDWMTFTHDMWEAFDGLEDVLRGGPAQGIHAYGPDDPYWERYLRGLFQLSGYSAPDVARAIRAPRRARTALDVAGGHGGYSMALCRRHRRLRATVVELEGAARVGRRIVAEHGMSGRVEHVVGDILTSDLRRPPAGYDIALAANIVHHLPRADAVLLLRRMRAALGPGGRLAVFEQERPEPGATGTQIGTLTGVLFHVSSGARTCTAAEVRGMLAEAGLRDVRVRRLLRAPGQMLVTGRA